MSSQYARRVVDSFLDDFQPHLRALALQGPKAVGKTATASQRARTVYDLSDDQVREIVAADPGVLTSAPGPVLVDEWQRLPAVWDMVKRAVDAGSPPGHFILAGSSVPQGAQIHSGAGRIVPLRMRPLSLAERRLQEPSVSLADLLEGGAGLAGATEVILRDYVREITASGLPHLRTLPAPVREIELDAYLDNVVTKEFPEQGYTVRRPAALMSWLTAYAAATCTQTDYTKIVAAAAFAKDSQPSKNTIIAWREALESLWLLEPVPAWPGHPALPALASKETHQLTDTALATRLLHLDEARLLRGESGSTTLPPVKGATKSVLGRLFENLVTSSVRTYSDAARAQVFHLRTAKGDHEVDIIIQRPDGKVLAIEVKLATTVDADDARHLRWLREKLGDDLVDAVVVTTGSHAYRRPDGVGVVPVALLGP
ncbi:hypothetical protein BCE75_101291 [Isoptericola sp. CG 20/1183]|uniref:AAA+ superfamily ATPase n=1 Tax=Isoptericola halotolerans TaxID=300560 RepID=A0ABX5EGH7_9MICO|nr:MULTISPECIES: DUF4143 domain-containing protein [Isoptericola]PRZ08589.1 hypothetical protein BCL65_102131 [Isoptericola halotolerans]PRZ10964.1 hypothetical protein BCE75_101291 [Isoptericola sp. CG 20/1183]